MIRNSFIEFFPGVRESRLPLIKLTKSKNGKTGTATFIFISPDIFNTLNFSSYSINKISLICFEKELSSSDITILFKLGNPFLIKAIFLFRNQEEWFQFLQFIRLYSKETGLFFSEINQ